MDGETIDTAEELRGTAVSTEQANRLPAPGTVIVGIDGSDHSANALDWAVAKESIFGQVTPVVTFRMPITNDLLPGPGPAFDATVFREAATARLMGTIEGREALVDRAVVIEAAPGAGLCRVAREADLLVVGTRGRGGMAAGLLGSVGSYCAKHATVPVVVVPPESPANHPLRNVLVGVDGSENADAALRWALDHVDPEGTVYAIGARSAWSIGGVGTDPPIEVLEKHARVIVEQAVDRVADHDLAAPAIEIRADAGDAREALRDLAGTRADLLVVGARGTTGIPYLLLGSVSSTLVHHPVVPTVVVPGQERSGRHER